MTPEGKILAHAKKECKRMGLRFIRLSFGPGNETGWADVLVLGPVGCGGQVLWMETKRRNKALTPIQAHRRDEVVSRGGYYTKPDTRGLVTRALEEFASICERKNSA